MSYKRNDCTAILVIVSAIALTLVTTTSFNHSYTAFAVSKKTSPKSGSGLSTLGEVPTSSSSSSSSSSAVAPNSNTLTKKQLSSFTSCINTANKSAEGLTHKVVTNCLDTAKGVTSTTASSSTTKGSSSSSLSLGPSTISKS
jgi:hypothetical protein